MSADANNTQSGTPTITSMAFYTTTALPDVNQGFLEILKKYYWVIIVAVVIVIVIVTIILIFRSCRRNSRFDYIALPTDVDLPMRLEIDRKKLKDEERGQTFIDFKYFGLNTALLNCSFYLRSTGRYTLYDHLPEIGSRLEKHWFLIQDKGAKGEKLLNMLKKSPLMPLHFNKASKKVLSEFFILLKHPYLYPVDDIDFVIEHDLIMVLHSYNPKGSLKDLIYNTHCCESWQCKYCYRGRGLSLPQIQIYGRQILEGMSYLEERGVLQFGHLHSGNVIMQNQTCRLTGYENTVLGLSSKMEPLLRKKLKTYKDVIDVLSFGHLLFEMAAGYELDTPAPEPKHMINISHQPTIEILYFIFENPTGNYPSVKEISQHDFFKHIVLRELQMYNIPPLHITPGVKGLIKALKKRKPKSSMRRSSVNPDKGLVELGTKITDETSPQTKKERRKNKSSNKKNRPDRAPKSNNTSAHIPVPGDSETHDSNVTMDLPEPSSARNALLADIRSGSAKLKSISKT